MYTGGKVTMYWKGTMDTNIKEQCMEKELWIQQGSKLWIQEGKGQ